MSLVNVFVQTTELVPTPIEGASVSIVPTVGVIDIVAQVTTGSNGIAAFDLPDGSYEIRAYKRGVIFPVVRFVLDGPSAFDLNGTLQTLPISLDPRCCRCTGRVVNSANRPLAGVMMIIRPADETGLETPKVVDSELVSPSPLYTKTNWDGIVSVDLLRGGQYNAVIAGEEDVVWPFIVPDRPSANLIDLMHPQPVSLYWDETKAPGQVVTLAVGERVEVPVSMLFSNYSILSQGVTQWVQLLNSAEAVVSAIFHQDLLILEGLGGGTATLTVEVAAGLRPMRVPPYSISAAPLSVVVN